jgi:hypothetical protein
MNTKVARLVECDDALWSSFRSEAWTAGVDVDDLLADAMRAYLAGRVAAVQGRCPTCGAADREPASRQAPASDTIPAPAPMDQRVTLIPPGDDDAADADDDLRVA